jgi:hypothetical protein
MQNTATQKIGMRQVHLDFHNSEHLKGIGEAFNKERFQESLKVGRVDSINLFAKCHHSWSYYPTKVGHKHPNLGFDLLGAQIEACHEIGVQAPIYYTFGWSANDAEAHPEWCVRDRKGEIVTNGTIDAEAKPDDARPGFQWKFLCANTDYHQHIMEQVEEICLRYPVDGLWFDIYQVYCLCFCDACQTEMKREGVDVRDDIAVESFNARMMKRHCAALRDLVQSHHPQAMIFFNGTTAIDGGSNFRHRMFENNTMQDLEDLPTVWGGYDKLPLQAKYFLQAGYPITAMSGKFHTAWGEFGGFKHPNALRYEAASMIAWGARCNFGDQLHPSGQMDAATYANIGEAYGYVESIAEYGIGGVPSSRIGFWRSFDAEHDEGLARILLETQNDFKIANLEKDWSEFEVILIPGVACLSDADAERLKAYAQEGGQLIIMGAGALNKNMDALWLDIGADYIGTADYDIDYLVVGSALREGLVDSPFLNYKAAIRLKQHFDSEVLATIHEPFFSRTYSRYTSHQNTPNRLKAASHAGIIQKGNCIWIAHELDWMYLKHGSRLHRDLYVNILKRCVRRPMITIDLPSAGRVSLLHQIAAKRYVVHCLYAPPIKRGACEVIEDLPPLYNVPLIFDLPQTITKVTLVPDNTELEIHSMDNKKTVMIPRFECHCVIVFGYK